MSRWTLAAAAMIVGTGITLGAFAPGAAKADEKESKESKAGASKDRETGDGDASKRIEQGNIYV